MSSNASFILDEGAVMVWLRLKYFEKSPTMWRIFNFYGGTARALMYECICTMAKDDSTVKLVCEGHSCCCLAV